jgi:nucleoid DNA-binding protein
MKKQDLINRIATRGKIDTKTARAITDDILDALKQALNKGDRFGGIQTNSLGAKKDTTKRSKTIKRPTEK